VKLKHDLHLAYCTNIHRGESWPETLAALQEFTLAVRNRVCPGRPYAIGLRLSDRASRELSRPDALLEFRRWLDRNNCYIFTINGFPYGRFHGQRVKEQVYRPDWTSDDRVNYTNRLFDLLGQLLPPGIEGSVSTVPGSFKEFITTDEQRRLIRANIFRCVEHIERVSERTGHRLHLGLEPEPLGLLETTDETLGFFDRLRSEHPNDSRLAEFLGVNYDTCHLAVEFENPTESLAQLRRHGIKISKLHLSSALKLRPTPETLGALAAFADDTYLHQVVSRAANGKLTRHKDLDVALAGPNSPREEWRVHFHIPLHSPPSAWFGNTTDHLLGVLDVLQADPRLCSHLEMETYTWEVMPPELKSRSVVEQLTSEYHWCLDELRARGLAD
jgi:sugar phosphate isomerase/epimerase